MTVKQHLEDLRLSRAEYLVVAYGDAATRLVLRASHDQTYRREYLDQLCDRAADCFRMMDATAALSGSDAQANQALLHTDGTTAIFARQDSSADEFLCIVRNGSDDLGALLGDAQATLAMVTASPW